MKIISSVLVAFVALQHLGFMVLEMFFWAKPLGMKIFKTTPAQAEATKVLAANQGLYNGFLMAGLIWSLCSQDVKLQVFFLSCVVIAGLFGAATASRSILFVQALPATVALIFVIWNRFS